MSNSKRAWRRRNKWLMTPPIKYTEIVRRDKNRERRKKAIKAESPRVAKLPSHPNGWEAQVFYDLSDLSIRAADAMSATLIESIKSIVTGRFKIVTKRFHRWAPNRVIQHVFLENESDVFLLMLCNREHVHKIFEFKKNEAPEGASLLLGSGFDHGSFVPETLTCIS